MLKVVQKSVFCFLAFSLLLVAGCASKTTGDTVPGGEDEDMEQPMTAEEREAARQISDAKIYFAYDSFSLAEDSKAVLRQKAHIVKSFPELRVLIEGHCDERGTEEYNLALGERRARVAYDFLVSLGVNPNQLEMVSFGKLHPARVGSGEEVWSLNRRDEFKVSKPI